MTIGQLAKRAGVGVETIRFYERAGVLGEPPRTPSGYREYDEGAVRVLQFVLRAKRLGFTLREVKELLALRYAPDARRQDVRRKATEKLADIDARIAELRAMRADLSRLVTACRGDGPAAGCPIIAAVGEETDVHDCPTRNANRAGKRA